MSSFFSYPTGTTGPVPSYGKTLNNLALKHSNGPAPSVIHSNSNIKEPLPSYIHYGVKPLVGAASGYAISNMLMYPGATLNVAGRDISRGAFVGAAIFAGLLAAEFLKDKFLDGLPKGISTFGTAATDIAVVSGIDYFAHILMDPSVAQDLSYSKVIMEGAGSVLIADYLTNHFILPWMGYETGV